MEDHVNLFFGIGPTISVSRVVQKSKGVFAPEMFDIFPWLKEYKLIEPRFLSRFKFQRFKENPFSCNGEVISSLEVISTDQ